VLIRAMTRTELGWCGRGIGPPSGGSTCGTVVGAARHEERLITDLAMLCCGRVRGNPLAKG
jgi:hypothetical protein